MGRKKKGLTDAQPIAATEPASAKPKDGRNCLRRIDPDMPDVELIEKAVATLREGGIVAIPTDTVYGLAVDATNSYAMDKLFALKGREASKVVPVLVDSMRLFRQIVKNLPDGAEELLDRFWPGALTAVVSKDPDMLPVVSKGETIGIRMPDSFVSLGLISMFERPLATTSANISGEEPAMSGEDVFKMFGNELDLILDGGTLAQRPASTVLDMTAKPYKILREGGLTRAALEEMLGEDLA